MDNKRGKGKIKKVKESNSSICNFDARKYIGVFLADNTIKTGYFQLLSLKIIKYLTKYLTNYSFQIFSNSSFCACDNCPDNLLKLNTKSSMLSKLFSKTFFIHFAVKSLLEKAG